MTMLIRNLLVYSLVFTAMNAFGGDDHTKRAQEGVELKEQEPARPGSDNMVDIKDKKAVLEGLDAKNLSLAAYLLQIPEIVEGYKREEWDLLRDRAAKIVLEALNKEEEPKLSIAYIRLLAGEDSDFIPTPPSSKAFVIPALIRGLKHPSKEVRLKTVDVAENVRKGKGGTALKALNQEELLNLLKVGMNDTEAEVRRNTMEFLMDDETFRGEDQAGKTKALSRETRALLMPVFKKGFYDKDADVRESALRRAEDFDSVELLQTFQSHPDKAVRDEVLAAVKRVSADEQLSSQRAAGAKEKARLEELQVKNKKQFEEKYGKKPASEDSGD